MFCYSIQACKGTVFNAADITTAAQAMSTDINVIEMKHDEIEEQNKDLNMYSVFEEAMPLKNITKMYCIFEHMKIVKGATLTNKISYHLAEYEIQSSSQAQSRQVSPENIKLVLSPS